MTAPVLSSQAGRAASNLPIYVHCEGAPNCFEAIELPYLSTVMANLQPFPHLNPVLSCMIPCYAG